MQHLRSLKFLLQAGWLLACVLIFATAPLRGTTITFDFDTGTPALVPTMSFPITQTAGGVTAIFSGRFSVQSHDTTFYNLPNFSGNYLVPNDVFSPPLSISFDHLLTSIGFDFATADFGLDTNTTLKLTAYLDSTSNPPVGSATSQAVGEGWGLGYLAFNSGGSPFNRAEIMILPGAGSDFLADNFIVASLDGCPTVPETASLVLVGAGLLALGTVARLRRRAWFSRPLSPGASKYGGLS